LLSPLTSSSLSSSLSASEVFPPSVTVGLLPNEVVWIM
jgi:hypothetical protein